MKIMTYVLFFMVPVLVNANSERLYHTIEAIDDQLNSIEYSVKNLDDSKLNNVKNALQNLREYVKEALRKFRHSLFKVEEPESSNGPEKPGSYNAKQIKETKKRILKDSGQKFKLDEAERNRLREEVEKIKEVEAIQKIKKISDMEKDLKELEEWAEQALEKEVDKWRKEKK
jgi:hypothetical protein